VPQRRSSAGLSWPGARVEGQCDWISKSWVAACNHAAGERLRDNLFGTYTGALLGADGHELSSDLPRSQPESFTSFPRGEPGQPTLCNPR